MEPNPQEPGSFLVILPRGCPSGQRVRAVLPSTGAEVVLTVPPPAEDGRPWEVLNVAPPPPDHPATKSSKPKTVHTPLSVTPNDATEDVDDFLITIPDEATEGETVRWMPPGSSTGRRFDFLVPRDAPRVLVVKPPPGIS